MNVCPLETEIRKASRDERWTPELEAHLTGCRDCAAASEVSPWMQRFARISDREHILPDPSLVWLKARLLRGSADAIRATRPLNFAQLFAYFVVAGGWATLMTWKWSIIEAWLRAFTPSGLVTQAARAESIPLSLVAMLIVMASITVTLAFHTILAEE